MEAVLSPAHSVRSKQESVANMDLLIGTYTEGTDALGIYGVVMSNERSPQAVALDIPVRNPSSWLPTQACRSCTCRGTQCRDGGGLVSALSWNGVGFSRLSAGAAWGGSLPSQYQPRWSTPCGCQLLIRGVVVFKLDDHGRIHGEPVIIEHQAEFDSRGGEAGRHSERQQQAHAHFFSGSLLVIYLCVILGQTRFIVMTARALIGWMRRTALTDQVHDLDCLEAQVHGMQ